MMTYDMLLSELSKTGRRGYSLPALDVSEASFSDLPPGMLRAVPPALPEVGEVDVIRHFTRLSKKNYAVDLGMYPLGSCTMKYNPKINEEMARLEAFSDLHPLQPEETVQGALQLMYETDSMLSELTGMARFSMQPAAGAQGETAGLMIIKAYHKSRGDHKRNKIIIPDSSHGTNPASAKVVGFDVVQIPSDATGGIDIEALVGVLGEDTAGLMLTNPSTLGLFEKNILEIAHRVHEAGGLLYYDGANANAILGIVRPGDMGFDVIHLNLHKTFSTPHGGGGPGSGPVGVVSKLVPYLPTPMVEKKEETYFLNQDLPLSIGKLRSFYGNFGMVLRAYCYILSMGSDGLKRVSEIAVLSANYMMDSLAAFFTVPYPGTCMHEFVLGRLKNNPNNITTRQIAKRLLDYGVHPPTIYFPLIVQEAMMIEPTETESIESMDAYLNILKRIAEEAVNAPELLRRAPHTAPVRQLDEVGAARNPVVRW